MQRIGPGSRRWLRWVVIVPMLTTAVSVSSATPTYAATGFEAISLSPNELVEDGVPITVTGSGFAPQVGVGLGQCNYVGLLPPDDFTYCGGAEGGAFTDDTGSFTATITPVRGFRGQSGLDVDCFTGCTIVAIGEDPQGFPTIVTYTNFRFGPLPAPPGTISFRRPGSAPEGNSGLKPLSVEVRHEPPSNTTVSVQWTTKQTPGAPTVKQADPGTDYIPASGTVTFAPGESRKNITISMKGDRTVEGDEAVIVYFHHPTNAPMDGHYGLGFINGDDGRVAGDGGYVVEGDSGTVILNVPVHVTRPPSEPLTVQWQAISWSGRPPFADPVDDFVVASGTATFPTGVSGVEVPITVKGDTRDEPDEYIIVSFSNPSTGEMAHYQYGGLGIGLIFDDD